VVGFISTLLVLAVGIAIIFAVGKRRPPGTPYTWGEAMVGGTVVFFLIFWAYGVVPHFLLMWADNELNWRPDILLADYEWAGGLRLAFFLPQEAGGWFPFTINMQHVRDVLVVVLYVALLGGNVYLWAKWQNRGAEEPSTEVVTSDYGRPLVKKG
jgi:hypothetical protein